MTAMERPPVFSLFFFRSPFNPPVVFLSFHGCIWSAVVPCWWVLEVVGHNAYLRAFAMVCGR
jgi:hypothetical protein